MIDFDEAHAEHNAALLRMTAARCGDLQAAADIVADVWAKAWQRRATFDPARGSVGAWLYVICRSATAEYYRRVCVKLSALSERDEPTSSPDIGRSSDLAEALDLLPDDWAAAVRAVYLHDRSYPEAAKALNCSVGVTHKRCVAGIKRLKELLAA